MSALNRKLLRDVHQRRWQFAAILVTVFLGVALFGATSDAYGNLTASYDALFERTRFAAFTAEGGDPETVRDALRGVDGVREVQARRVADVPFRIGGRNVLGRLVSVPNDPAPINDVLLLDGTRTGGAAPRDAVVVERHLADAFDLRPGDRLEIRTADGWVALPITGIGASPEYVWPARSRQEVFTLPDQFGVAFGADTLLDGLPAASVRSQVLVTTRGPADDPALLQELRARALAAGALDTFTRADQPSNATLEEDIQGFGELSLLFPMLFLGAAGLAAYVLLSRMVLAQRRQVGLLLAVGYRRRRVFAHYLGYGLLVGVGGAVAGALAGLALAGLITRMYTDVIGIPLSLVELRPTTVLAGTGFGLVAGGLSALVPALRAARLSPATAMSATTGGGVGSVSRAERLLPPLRGLPARWRMVIRGVGRAPVRSISTVVGVMLAATLVLVSWGMLDTVQVLLDRQFGIVQQEDAALTVPGGVTPEVVAAVAGTTGVAAVEPVARLPITLVGRGPDARYSTTLVALPAATVMHRFLAPDGGEDHLRGGVLLGLALRDRLGLEAGDAVRLHLADGGTATARVDGFVDEPLGTFAYASTGALATIVGDPAAETATRALNVRFSPAADRAATLDRLQRLNDVTAAVDARALERAARSLMGLFYAFVGIMLVLGAVMAFAVLFNLMAANIGERVTELASLRAAGMRGGELGRIISAENLLLTVAGILPGLAVGYLAAAEFMAAFSSDLFHFELHVRPTTFAFTALGILGAALLSQLPILRAVRGIDVARVVRERAS